MSNRHCCIPGHEVRLDPLKFQNFSVDFWGTIFWEGWEVSWLTIFWNLYISYPYSKWRGGFWNPNENARKNKSGGKMTLFDLHSVVIDPRLIDFPSSRNFWNQSFLVQKGQSPAMPFRSLRKDRKMVPRWTWGKKIGVDRSSESQTFVKIPEIVNRNIKINIQKTSKNLITCNPLINHNFCITL